MDDAPSRNRFPNPLGNNINFRGNGGCSRSNFFGGNVKGVKDGDNFRSNGGNEGNFDGRNVSGFSGGNNFKGENGNNFRDGNGIWV